MRVSFVVVITALAMALVACQPAPAEAVQDSPVVAGVPTFSFTTPVITAGDDSITLMGDRFSVSLPKPNAWESFTTEYGVVMGEAFGSVATGGMLEGLMTYMFTSPLTDFAQSIAAATDDNLAYAIQSQIVSDVDYIGSARATRPTSFDWDGFPASFYLLSDSELGIYTMVVGIVVEDSDILLTCTISAPMEQGARIRQSLSQLLDGLSINGTRLAVAALENLPDPLMFPQ